MKQWRTSVSDAFSADPNSGLNTHGENTRNRLNAWSVIDGGVVAGNWVSGLEYTRLQRPIAIAVRGQWLYIVDADLDTLFRYDLGLHRLTVLKDLRNYVPGDVGAIYVTRALDYYLADTDGARVLHFAADGRLLETIHDDLDIGRPVGIYVDEGRDRLFIADGFNDDVLVYNQARGLIGPMGVRGDLPGQFRRITAFAASAKGYYVATRFGEHRIWHMGLDGRYVDALQKDTVTFPMAIAAGDGGRVFAADYLDNTIRVYQDSRMVKIIGHSGSAPGQFKRVTGLWLDGDTLYVADSLNGRIQYIRVPDLDLPQLALPQQP